MSALVSCVVHARSNSFVVSHRKDMPYSRAGLKVVNGLCGTVRHSPADRLVRGWSRASSTVARPSIKYVNRWPPTTSRLQARAVITSCDIADTIVAVAMVIVVVAMVHQSHLKDRQCVSPCATP
jgi:hypothetical protein